jgi:hypothetical protein
MYEAIAVLCEPPGSFKLVIASIIRLSSLQQWLLFIKSHKKGE